MDELVALFLAESSENLARVDQAFLALEQDPAATGVIADVFRTMHTLKGTCGFLGLARLERLSHSAESLLARVRDGERAWDEHVAQALFDVVDAVRAVLASLAAGGGEGDASHADLIERLRALESVPPALPAAPSASAAARTQRGAPASAPAARASGADSPSVAAPLAGTPAAAAPLAGATTIRVDVAHIDRLMDLAGELLLARNQVRAHAGESEVAGLRACSQRLSAIAEDLQQGVMRARLQPIAHAWSGVPRLVRDLCAQLGKRAAVELSGSETAVDRSLLEGLRDPLTHMVRNAIDHGIETPAERARAGKPEQGRLALRAWTQGGTVRIDVVDDGAGIDPAKLRRLALERGVIDAAEAARMSDAESLGLVFRAGFTTAARVSNLSGRGVGLDVVKTNVERLGGSVHVASELGAGTRIELRIPLTLAVQSVLTVGCAGQCFALPAAAAVEVVRVPAAGREGAPELVHGAAVLRLRGALLPLVALRGVLGLPAAPDGEAYAIVVESEARRFGLVVDSPGDIEEIVVKPLGTELAALQVYAGATIRGDGRVALVLDLHALAKRGQIRRAREGEARAARAPSALPSERVLQGRGLLICTAGGESFALELEHVLRLEPRSALAHVGRRRALAWRGAWWPLVALRELDGARDGAGGQDEDGELVAFCGHSGRGLALALPRELDALAEPVELRRSGACPWTAGEVRWSGRSARLVDLPALVRARGADVADALAEEPA